MDLVNRNISTSQFFLRHGKEPTIAELEAYTFESVVFTDGTQLKDVTFDELTSAVWNLVNKNVSSTTLINKS